MADSHEPCPPWKGRVCPHLKLELGEVGLQHGALPHQLAVVGRASLVRCALLLNSGLGLRVQGLRFRVQGTVFRVRGAGFRVEVLGLRVEG